MLLLLWEKTTPPPSPLSRTYLWSTVFFLAVPDRLLLGGWLRPLVPAVPDRLLLGGWLRPLVSAVPDRLLLGGWLRPLLPAVPDRLLLGGWLRPLVQRSLTGCSLSSTQCRTAYLNSTTTRPTPLNVCWIPVSGPSGMTGNGGKVRGQSK